MTSRYDVLKDGLLSVGCAFGLLHLGKKIKENEILRKQNQRMQKQLQVASRSGLSWDSLRRWLQGL